MIFRSGGVILGIRGWGRRLLTGREHWIGMNFITLRSPFPFLLRSPQTKTNTINASPPPDLQKRHPIPHAAPPLPPAPNSAPPPPHSLHHQLPHPHHHAPLPSKHPPQPPRQHTTKPPPPTCPKRRSNPLRESPAAEPG